VGNIGFEMARLFVSTGRAGGFTVAGPSKGPFRNRPKQKQEQKQKPDHLATCKGIDKNRLRAKPE
jgi:hypothetical protein